MDVALGLDTFAELAPAGYYVAVRIGFAYPMSEQNTLPAPWIAHYTSNGFMMHDPVVKWVYGNTGFSRWSDIEIDDPRDVLGQAAQFGLRYGAVVSCLDDSGQGQRSYASFVNNEREFSDAEIKLLGRALIRLHVSFAPPTNLTKAELEVLRMVKDGLLMKQIADQLGVSQGAIKQRLKNAKLKLKAKTSTQAATLAVQFGLI